MRIVILSQYYPPEIGAAPTRVGMFARTLRRLGCDVEVLTAVPNYPEGSIYPKYRGVVRVTETESTGVIVHRHWVYGAQGAGLGRYLAFLSLALSSCLSITRIQKPDLVLVQSPPLTLILPGCLLKLVYRARMVFHVADLWPDTIVHMGVVRNGPLLWASYALERFTYWMADGVNGVTEAIVATLRGPKGVPATKVHFVPNGVDLETYQPMEPDAALARELGVEGRKLFLFAGTYAMGTGLELYGEVAGLLRDDPSILLYLVGAGPLGPSLRASAQAQGLTNLIVAEAVPPQQVARLYALATAGLASLRKIRFYEGARPTKLLPAMACGKPVIFAGAGEAAQLITDHGAGLVVPPEDAAAFAEAIRTLAYQPDLARRMGASGRRFVAGELSWSRILETWLASLQAGG